MAEEKIEIEPVLETVLLHCLDEAKTMIEQEGAVTPFTALAIGKELVMERHPADSASDAFAAARKRVAQASDVEAYCFCYDGFVEVEKTIGTGTVTRDCIIAEGGAPGAEYGHAIGLIYRAKDDGTIRFNTEPMYVSQALNYLSSPDDDEFGIETFTGAIDPAAE